MQINMLKSKIHRAVVTDANPEYVGSITIDKELMDAAGLFEYEQVHVADINNGSRLVTYVMEGEAGSGCICINGAAAKLVNAGDIVIIMSYCRLSVCDVKNHKPKIVLVDDKIKRIKT